MNRIKHIILRVIHDPWHYVSNLLMRSSVIWPDKIYLKLLFRSKMGYWPSFNKPRSFNEKLNWLKLYNRNHEYPKMVDKYSVKDYVSNAIGKDYIIPTLGVWNSPTEIDWDSLPNKFVLKTTHGGGGCGVVICNDKDTFDKNYAVRKLCQSMKSNVYLPYREWPYKFINKRILAEDLLVSDGDLKDYKFFCFNGKVKFFKIDSNRFVQHHANYYSPQGNLLPLGEVTCPPQFESVQTIPENLDKMIRIAEKLSAVSPFMRVDLYNIKGRIYFGEITFFPAGGMGRFIKKEQDYQIGEMLNCTEYVK